MPTHISMTAHRLPDPTGKKAIPANPRLFRRLAVVDLFVIVALSLLFASAPRFLRDLDTACSDLIATTMPVTAPQPEIVIVEIDESSLASHGQWPWPRNLMAKLIEAIVAGRPAVVATNILFPERDRSSPPPPPPEAATATTPTSIDEVAFAPINHDQLFAARLATGPIILGYELLFDRGRERKRPPCRPPALIAPANPSSIETLHRASDILCNYPPLQEAASGAGFLNGAADEDGVLRRLPLLMEFEEQIFPSLALATIMHLFSPASWSMNRDDLGGLKVQFAGRRVLLDPSGQIRLSPTAPQAIHRLSADKLLNGNLDGSPLRGKIVLLGCLAPGLTQSYPTPFAPSTPLLDLHAAAIATLLAPVQLYRPTALAHLEWGAAILVSLLLLAIAGRYPIGGTTVLAVALAIIVWLGAMLLCQSSGLLLSPLKPSLAIFVTAILLVAVSLRHQKREAQALLKASEQRLRSIIHTVPDIIFRLTAEGAITFISPAIRRFGRAPEDLLGHSIFSLIHPDDRQRAAHRINERRTGARATADLEMRLLLGETDASNQEDARFFSVSAEGLYVDGRAGGAFLGTQGIARDITEKKKLEQQLLQAQKMEVVGNLAAGVAHDLNNILTGLVSYPDLMLLEIPPENPLHGKIATLRNSGKKAAAIVQDLLCLSRRKVPANELTDINTVIDEYLHSPEFHELQRNHVGVTVSAKLQANPATIRGSAVQLSKMVMNLMHNAVEASSAGGEVMVATDNLQLTDSLDGYERIDAGDYLRIIFSDCGGGIASADQPRIFEPFFTRKKAGRSGTGLGLSIVWSTVKDHRGFLDLASREGVGTTFQIYLPLAVTRSEQD